MGMNQTPASERVHISFFGKRNSGKSSIINAVTGQDLAIVSDVRGTTTDPVYKTMELLPVGPVMLIDTPGIDDEGELGALRVKKSYQVLNKTDVALLIVDGPAGLTEADRQLVERFRSKEIPYLIVYNKMDRMEKDDVPQESGYNYIWVSAKEKKNIHELKEKIADLARTGEQTRRIVGDLLQPGDLVLLVVPVDSAAPKGRLILPQQQTIRDVLESDAAAVIVKENGLKDTLAKLGTKPRLVVTDSQVFSAVSAAAPENIPLTSFSILFARYKGDLHLAARGAEALETLKDGDRILIAEGCTHHRQCDDIGTVKLPRWIEQYTGVRPEYHFVSGVEFPEDLSEYHMVIHCGACMLNDREVKYRLAVAEEQGIPVTNYGILIAYMKGILERSMAPFGLN